MLYEEPSSPEADSIFRTRSKTKLFFSPDTVGKWIVLPVTAIDKT